MRLEEDLEVMAITFPAICSPLRALVEVEQYSHLHDLDLADVDSSDDHLSDDWFQLLLGCSNR